MPDKDQLATWLAGETGLPLTATTGVDADGDQWIRLAPEGVSAQHAFAVRVTVAWRRLTIAFEPGNFAGGLLEDMSAPDADGRSLFRATLSSAINAGAEVVLRIDGADRLYDDDAIWGSPWKRFSLELRKGNIPFRTGDVDDDGVLRAWAGVFMAALLAILPVEVEQDVNDTDNQAGFPEGAAKTVTVNRYERDRRNRAAAIAIHGLSCKACDMNFGERYGPIASGFIEVHHTVPVSRLGTGYVIDPRTDLIPLCSNCHSVAHRQDPPMAVEDIRRLLQPVA